MPLWGTGFVGLYWLVNGLRDSEDSITHDWPSIFVGKRGNAPSSEFVIGVEMVYLDEITWSVGVPE
jgi:hypothetical protein